MRLVFMGTPDFAVPALQALAAHHEIAAVYTQPPRPKGRGRQVQASPVQAAAERLGFEVRSPLSLKKDAAARAAFAGLDADIAVVAAYGLILPQDVLDAPRHGCVNIHASLLPRWRGASPIQHAILAGDEETGVTIMRMEAGLDTGPMIAKGAVPILPQTTASSLHDSLAALGAAMIVETLATGVFEGTVQDDALATYAPLLRKEDGILDWTSDASALDRQIRALNPWPGTWTVTDQGVRIKILTAELVTGADIAPGQISMNDAIVGCGDRTRLRLVSVQPDGARAMDFASAVNGGYLTAATRFAT